MCIFFFTGSVNGKRYRLETLPIVAVIYYSIAKNDC